MNRCVAFSQWREGSHLQISFPKFQEFVFSHLSCLGWQIHKNYFVSRCGSSRTGEGGGPKPKTSERFFKLNLGPPDRSPLSRACVSPFRVRCCHVAIKALSGPARAPLVDQGSLTDFVCTSPPVLPRRVGVWHKV